MWTEWNREENGYKVVDEFEVVAVHNNSQERLTCVEC